MKRSIWLIGVVAALALGCAKSAEQQAAVKANDPARQEEWKWIEGTKKTLDQKREELASLRDQLANGAAVAPQIDTLNAELAKIGDEFSRRLVDYINADPPIAGEPMSPGQLAAIRMKSGEDIQIAKEHIEMGGDYRKAIDIYNMSLSIDPDNPDLKAALEEAEAKRFMTAERFAQVKKGMGELEVVRAIGRPLTRNMRDYPEKKVSAWFYPKNESGEAAGVFFNDKKLVYSTEFNAVKHSDEAAASGN
jgi:hypothetical protein